VERFEDGKLYALKQTNIRALPQHVRQDVVNEARLLASIRHPHVVKYYEAFMDGNFLCGKPPAPLCTCCLACAPA
jgi:serine/threonine protein kinase